jgi:uncharacterized Zn finger protein
MKNIDTPCPSFSPEKKEKKVPVRVIVSIGEKSLRISTLLSGVIRVGDELVIDDEISGVAYPVHISSIEVGDKRKESAQADEIKTIWARAIDEVVVKIAISHRETTESIEMKVPGDREFIIGEKIKVDSRELKIIRIKIRDSGFKSRKGVVIKASDIKRIYAESGQREPRRFSKAGERIVIKKRESVWSLKTKKTDL